MVILLGSGCSGGDEEEPAILMPDVVGLRLDVALSDIENAGISEEAEILGGGTFGVIDEANWEVCEQTPEAGEPIADDTPRLVIERECDSSDEDNSSSEEPTPTESISEATPTPEQTEVSEGEDSSSTAEEMEAKLEENIGLQIPELCGIDDDYDHWSCFYDGVEDGSGYLRVNLTTDGGWSDQELEELAATAGRHWFNFIGCDFPDLDTIVVRVNGIDHNVFRSSTLVDQVCD